MPRLLDARQTNAQNLNAKALAPYLAALPDGLVSLCYWDPPAELAALDGLRIKRLVHGRAWTTHLMLSYVGRYHTVFYPGAAPADLRGIALMDLLKRGTRLVVTVEGLVGNAAREKEYSEVAGHPVFCQHLQSDVLRRCDALLERADRIIAISPFLARMVEARYGKSVEVLSLGVEASFLNPAAGALHGKRLVVVGAGHLQPHKRPERFLHLAQRRPDVDFVWYGDGPLRMSLRDRADELRLPNVRFPGAVEHGEMAAAFHAADLFVLPSRAEGAPKVALEAAACGLPLVLFGFYEPPMLLEGENGLVVWDDAGLDVAVDRLLDDAGLRTGMAARSREVARGLTWDEVGPRWAASVAEVGAARLR